MISNHTPASNDRPLRSGRAKLRPLFAAGFALALGIAGLSANTPATAQEHHDLVEDQTSATLISSMAHPVPPNFRADTGLLVHTMPSITGQVTRASTLPFVPRGAPPADGWPVVA